MEITIYLISELSGNKIVVKESLGLVALSYNNMVLNYNSCKSN